MILSIVIPAFNEAPKIEHDLTAVLNYLQNKGPCEVLIVDDGSTDNTAQIVRDFVAREKSAAEAVRLLSYGSNRGKGFAVRYGVAHSQGKFVAFVDSGLCVPFHYLDVGLANIQAGADFALASRRLQGAKIRHHQPLYRRYGSKVFWVMMRAIMAIEVSDTQCGFKIYRGEVARQIFGALETDGFMFDIEALRVARQMGFRGSEFPVEWSNDEDTRYHPVFGTWRNLTELMNIRRREWIKR